MTPSQASRLVFPGPVCAVLTPRRVADVYAGDVRGADCIEVRLDYLEDPFASSEVQWNALSLPVIATCRSEGCGGLFAGSFDEELRILERAVRNGACYVDIDYRMARPVDGAGVIASFHDFEGTPPELQAITRAVSEAPGMAGKVAVMTRTWGDVRRVLDLSRAEWGKPMITVGMGATGQITRVVAPSRGSSLTYASLAQGGAEDGTEAESAPGQLSLRGLLETYRFRAIQRSTRLLGIVGNPVGHSASPALHNRAFSEAGLDYVYLPLPVESLEDFFSEADAIGIVGFSVTIPHKVDILRFLDEVSPEARMVGAVNTVTRRDGKWIGENTDVHGIREALRELDLGAMRVVILGTGGAARAAVAAVTEARSVSVLSRTMTPGPLGWARGVDVERFDPCRIPNADLLINATPVGMSPDVDRTPVECPIPARVVFDMVYNPEDTRLLREARIQGKRTISGRTMFVAQAARQFEIWTGCPASPIVFSEVSS